MTARLLLACAACLLLTPWCVRADEATLRFDVDRHCGAYCLYVALAGLDFSVGSFEEFKSRLGPATSAGYSVARLHDAALSYGANALAVETDLESVRSRQGRFACIALLTSVKSAHFALVLDADDKEVILMSPPNPSERVPRNTFMSQWHGTALLVSKEPLEKDVITGGTRIGEARQSAGMISWSLWIALGAVAVLTLLGVCFWLHHAPRAT